MRNITKPIYPIERIIAVLSYVSVGFVGFIWLIIAALLKKRVTSFVMYHILQSIFLSMLFYIISILVNLINMIPIINYVSLYLVYILSLQIPFLFGLSIIQAFTTGVMIYLVITSMMGKYSYIPWVSDIISTNTGR